MLIPLRGVKVQKRTQADTNRLHGMRRRKRDIVGRIQYPTIITAMVLPAGAFIYAIRNEGVIPQNSMTWISAIVYYNISMLAFSAGYHKCYAHLVFRPGRVMSSFFAVFGSSVGLGPIRWWAGLHRAHHQHTDDPDRDPYSSLRGFWWAHCGWLALRPKATAFYETLIEHEFPLWGGEETPTADSASNEEERSKRSEAENEVEEESAELQRNGSIVDAGGEVLPDAADAEADAAASRASLATASWLRWQQRHYWILIALTTLLIPGTIAVYICEDSWINGVIYIGLLRMFACQQLILATESVCHRRWPVTIPNQPFNDKNSLVDCLNPLMAIVTYGQAAQNFHHEFPHDYRSSALPWAIDPTKWFIWVLAKLRLVTDVGRSPTALVVQLRIQQQQLVLNRMRSQLHWGTPISKLPHITTREFRRISADDARLYIVIQNIIHDITPFMDQHPGGLALLRASHGKDATKAFYGGVYGHLTAAVNLLATMRIGVLDVGNDEDIWRRVAREEGEVTDRRKGELYRTAEAA